MRNITDFFSNEYKQQAANANFSKIANIFGLKVTANKVIHTMLNKNIKTWHKTEVISSMTALDTIYMGGSGNIDGVISNICSTYAGSNNLCLVDKKGQIGGSRMSRTSAASRYTFVRQGEALEKYFNKVDLNILPRYNFENTDIEYKFFTFNIPLILVNGSSGIGSGHSCLILPGSLDEITEHLKNKLNNKPSNYNFKPFFNNFSGRIEQGEETNKWNVYGAFKHISKTKIEITDVPTNESYKSYIKKLNILVDNGVINKFDDKCDFAEDTFNFIIYHNFGTKTDDDIYKILKLRTIISENYTLNNEHNEIMVFKSRAEIFEYWYKLKLIYIEKRKIYLIKTLSQSIKETVSKYIFIKNITEDTLIISKRKKRDIEDNLEKIDNIIKIDGSFDYLLNMSIMSLTIERMTKLLDFIKKQKSELDTIKQLTLEDVWLLDFK